MVELQSMLAAFMVQRNRQIRVPVPGAGCMKCEEHRLEHRATLISPLQFLRTDIQPADLKLKTLDELFSATALTKRCQILVENRLAGAPRVTPFGIGHKNPIAKPIRLCHFKMIVTL